MYHIALDIKHKKITIIGGGKVAYRKAVLLSQEACNLYIISPKFIESFHSLDSCVHRINKRYEKGDCKGSLLVFIATNDTTLNEQIKADCKEEHILCNVVDNCSKSDFITPAQVIRGDLTLSVSTNGKSPALAAFIKNELAWQYDASYAQRVALLGQIREHILSQDIEEVKKKNLLNQVILLNNEELVCYLENLIQKGNCL